MNIQHGVVIFDLVGWLMYYWRKWLDCRGSLLAALVVRIH